METKTVILYSFEFKGKEYYAEATVTYSINIEQGYFEYPTFAEIDIEGVEIWELQVYRPEFNDWVDCNRPAVAKAVTEHITNNFEL